MKTINIKTIEMLRVTTPLSLTYFTDTVGIDIEDYMSYIENPRSECLVSDVQINTISQIFGVPRAFIIQGGDHVIGDDDQTLEHLRQFQKMIGSSAMPRDL